MKPSCPREWNSDNVDTLAFDIVNSWDHKTLFNFAKEKVAEYMNDDKDAFMQEWDDFHEGADLE